jgi:hypothetical protein
MMGNHKVVARTALWGGRSTREKISGRRRAVRVFAAALFVAVVAVAGPAAAQRGEDFALTEEHEVSSNPTPNQGIPGLFDTELVAKGAFVANAPATSLYYGVTPRLTIGTIVASYASVAVGPPGASVLARYLLAGGARFRSTVDALMLGTSWSSSGAHRSLRVGLFGSNTEFALNPSNRLTANLWLVHVSYDPADDDPGTGTAFLAGGTYSLTVTPRMALHVTALYAASVTGTIDTPRMMIDIDGVGARAVADRVILRAMLSLRRGPWLFDLGAVRAGPFYVPWINVAVQMGS